MGSGRSWQVRGQLGRCVRRGARSGSGPAASPRAAAAAACWTLRALDGDDVGADRTRRTARRGSRRRRAACLVVTVHQQNLDQGPGPAAVAVGLAGRGPERFVGGGERARLRGPGPARSRRAAPRACGPGPRGSGPARRVCEPRVVERSWRATWVLPSNTTQLGGAQDHPDPVADQPGRDRVVALAHGDPRVAVDPRGQRQPGLEPLGRQRAQQGGLEGEVLPDVDGRGCRSAGRRRRTSQASDAR